MSTSSRLEHSVTVCDANWSFFSTTSGPSAPPSRRGVHTGQPLPARELRQYSIGGEEDKNLCLVRVKIVFISFLFFLLSLCIHYHIMFPFSFSFSFLFPFPFPFPCPLSSPSPPPPHFQLFSILFYFIHHSLTRINGWTHTQLQLIYLSLPIHCSRTRYVSCYFQISVYPYFVVPDFSQP